MKKQLFTLLAILLISLQATYANNILVSNVGLTNKNVAQHHQLINFDVAWDNSWNINIGPANHDAAWIFVKYRRKDQLVWKHATLNWVNGTGTADGHTEPQNSDIISSNDNAANGAYGVFIRRTDLAIGSVNFAGTKLRWNYGADGIDDYDAVEVRVIAIEMVYVPQGAFYVGSGGTIYTPPVTGVSVNIGEFYTYPNTSSTYLISSEAAINVGPTNGNLFYNNGLTFTIPAAFPKGYKAFYCMKYEITQAEYVAFLNTLTWQQQDIHSQALSNVIGQMAVAGGGSFPYCGNGIKLMTPGTYLTQPKIFGCDFDNDLIFNELNDGQSKACGWLIFQDLNAYLDWAAIRPMSELEYEKAGRGTKFPYPNEFAWGNTTFISANTSVNSGANNETAQVGANVNANYTVPVPNGVNTMVLRVGVFANALTNRVQSGASFYGIMDLSGNVTEYAISSGNSLGRNFTDQQGDGILNAWGSTDIPSLIWPAQGANWPVGYCTRGGGVETGPLFLSPLQLSSGAAQIRNELLNGVPGQFRNPNFGGRGIRSAPF